MTGYNQGMVTGTEQARKPGRRIGRHNRTDDQKAALVAVAKVLPGGPAEAAQLLEIPERSIRLYVQQAKEKPGEGFADLCRAKSDELGAMGYDLAGGALRRLGARLEKDELSERGLLSLAGLGHNIGKEAFGHGPQAQAPQTVVNVLQIDAGSVLARLEQLAAGLAEQAALPAPVEPAE